MDNHRSGGVITNPLNQSQQVTTTNKSIGRDSTNSGGARTNIRSIRSLQQQLGMGGVGGTSKKDKVVLSDLSGTGTI